MKKLFILLLFISSIFAQTAELRVIKALEKEIQSLNATLENPNNIWMRRYFNYQSYQQTLNNLAQTQSEIDELKKDSKDIKSKERLIILERNLIALEQQKKVLEVYKDLPFAELTQIESIGELPKITNPLLIIKAYSYIKDSNKEIENLNNNFKLLEQDLKFLEEKDKLLKKLLEIYTADSSNLGQICIENNCLFESKDEILSTLRDNLNIISAFQTIKEVFKTTLEVSIKDIEENKAQVKAQIKAQFIKGVTIFITLLILVAIAFFLKLGAKKYIHDNERIYTANKIINFLNILLIVLILLFSYLDNVGYLVTVLGFASAGLAIAMKDLFMSMLGWIVIVVGGSVHAGDRIKVIKDGAVYVGDVLDISVLRITLYEDITLTSYRENRRAGRIIFIPNNYIFTTLISNYTHGGMKTVWDGIDFTITFDSDHARASQIARECARKYAKGYIDSTRRQFAKFHDRFTLRSTNVEPRVFSMIEQNGIRISLWYLTNAYATLGLRSN